jgi:hypothetical protein
MLPKSFSWFDWMIDGDDGIVRDSECAPSQHTPLRERERDTHTHRGLTICCL